MANELREYKKRERRKIKLSARLTIPILLVVVLQLLTFFAILVFGGEFRNIRQYAYSTLEEKTANRRNYLQTELQEKPSVVRTYSQRVNAIVDGILEERGESAASLRTDSDLDRAVIEACVETMSNLLRRTMVNDVYLVLETGDLYGDGVKAALYLRDLDPVSGTGYEDLLLEVGYDSISQNLGIKRDSGWSLYLETDPEDGNDDFYYRTLQTAMENPALSLGELGYWSGFSGPSDEATLSMKYSLPLIAEDGTVYGVIGVGLTETDILSYIPSNDFLDETACYVLGRGNADKEFDILLSSGSAFARLVGGEKTLRVTEMLDEGIWDFDLPTDTKLAGSVQTIELYDENSPYAGEQWALISVADRATVLRPMYFLIQMLLISTLVSMAVAVVVAVPSCMGITRPISDAIRRMNDKRKFREVIRFQPSNIIEIDKMTDAITRLQINVQEFSSQVSKMITVADVGLGTFLYDRADGSVFVGQSLLKLLRMEQRQEDLVMTWQDFLDSIYVEKLRDAIKTGIDSAAGEQEDYTRVYRIDREDGESSWVRVSAICSENTSIGILQDVTGTMLEKKRIEYERDYDSFTGLLNRHAYYRRIEEMFREKDKLKVTAFVMIDLDNLKYVNDTYGHDFGDDYIKTAAAILKKFQNYGGIVSRISGDEFNICLPGFSSKDEVRRAIANVRGQLLQGTCLLADGTHFKIRASFGVSWYPDDADTYEMLMKYADFAMYTVKRTVKGEIAEFDMASYAADYVLLTGVEEMNRIIEERAVKYAFQSVISAKTGEIYGYEALMRVQSRVFQSPLELLRAAKTGARLGEIERLTWTKSLEDFRDQIKAGNIEKDARIFINSIASARLDPADERALQANYPDMLKQIVLEILESENSNDEYTAHKAEIIKKFGGQMALDDFGTGYNSEYALITTHPNIVKIDHSIVSGCDKDVSRRMIITNLVKFARAKQILVLAEGVETDDELKTVIACGVDLLQGYFFSRPLYEPQPIPPEITAMIRQLAS